jgi:hypothetical protein
MTGGEGILELREMEFGLTSAFVLRGERQVERMPSTLNDIIWTLEFLKF